MGNRYELRNRLKVYKNIEKDLYGLLRILKSGRPKKRTEDIVLTYENSSCLLRVNILE